jgi:predicted enzyme related to lactoylglutathione lyase
MEPNLRLAFFKLNVSEIVPALAFWREAFGFEVAQTFDEAEFHEKVLALPGQAAGPNLMLVTYKDGRDVTVGHGHGAVGIQCADIAAAHERALAAGAKNGTGIMTVGNGIKVAVLHSPQGHEIELVQLPG